MSKLQARNETIINVPLANIWKLITDINILHEINPGVVKATGRMDKQGETRTCEMDNQGKHGTMTERLVELIPEKRTVWTIESDNMGFSKMLKDSQFCFHLEKVDANRTKVVNETYYRPANLIASIMSALVIKRTISKAQEQILTNLKKLAEQQYGVQ